MSSGSAAAAAPPQPHVILARLLSFFGPQFPICGMGRLNQRLSEGPPHSDFFQAFSFLAPYCPLRS